MSLTQSGAKRRKINRPWPWSNQFWRWSRYIIMQNFRLFPLCVLWQMHGNLSGRMDGHASRWSRLIGWTNGPMYRWIDGISGFGRMDGQPKIIMPPAPKGGGITKRTNGSVQDCHNSITNVLELPQLSAKASANSFYCYYLIIGLVV